MFCKCDCNAEMQVVCDGVYKCASCSEEYTKVSDDLFVDTKGIIYKTYTNNLAIGTKKLISVDTKQERSDTYEEDMKRWEQMLSDPNYSGVLPSLDKYPDMSEYTNIEVRGFYRRYASTPIKSDSPLERIINRFTLDEQYKEWYLENGICSGDTTAIQKEENFLSTFFYNKIRCSECNSIIDARAFTNRGIKDDIYSLECPVCSNIQYAEFGFAVSDEVPCEKKEEGTAEEGDNQEQPVKMVNPKKVSPLLPTRCPRCGEWLCTCIFKCEICGKPFCKHRLQKKK